MQMLQQRIVLYHSFAERLRKYFHGTRVKHKREKTFDCEDIFQTVKSRKRHEILVFQSTTPLKIASKENRAAMEKRNSETNDLFLTAVALRSFYLLYPSEPFPRVFI